jgi:hypothetical protein
MSKPVPILTFAPKISPEAPAWLQQHLTLIYQKLNNHTQAMSLLAGKSSGPTTNNTTVQESVVTGGGGSPTTPASVGAVDNQSGVTTYATTQGDYGAVVVLSDGSPIAVSLSTQAQPWFCWVVNLGAGVATLTPIMGTINNGASFPLLQNCSAVVAFDGVSWWAGSSPIVPANTPAVSHQWLASYNSSTGIFTLSQPSFSDVSGIATVLQGGTGTSTPGLVAGANISVTGAWPNQSIAASTTGLSVTITTAKLTTGGANGSQTFTAGLLTAQTPAT